MPIQIHGKEYITVAERVEQAHKDVTGENTLTITTEVLYQDPVVIKATVVTPKGTYTGISAANPSKMIEKNSPYEVAETSAVGRALGFAGYGIAEGIATADEVSKAGIGVGQSQDLGNCADCGSPNVMSAKGNKYCSKRCWLEGTPRAAEPARNEPINEDDLPF